jgi:hypothetical protein
MTGGNMGSAQPILYIGSGKESEVAQSLLREAGFEVEVKVAPSFYEIAYGTPVLFALSNRFEGVEGVRVFMENARILGRSKTAAA